MTCCFVDRLSMMNQSVLYSLKGLLARSSRRETKMTMSVKSETQKTSGGPQECAGCGKKIQDRYLLKALDMFWHEDCLKCGCCDCRLGEVGSTLYTKGNLILCKRDYLRLFGTTGYCAACNKVIPAFEMVMRARTNVYHLECFACQQCNHRFCVGDRFFLCDNKILCEYDYEERMVFANLAYNSSSLAHIKQQAARSVSSKDPSSMANGMSSSPCLPAGHPALNPTLQHHMNGMHHNVPMPNHPIHHPSLNGPGLISSSNNAATSSSSSSAISSTSSPVSTSVSSASSIMGSQQQQQQQANVPSASASQGMAPLPPMSAGSLPPMVS